MAAEALADGLTAERACPAIADYLRRMLDGHVEIHCGMGGGQADIRFLKGFVFIFSGSSLLTCWRVPGDVMRRAR